MQLLPEWQRVPGPVRVDQRPGQLSTTRGHRRGQDFLPVGQIRDHSDKIGCAGNSNLLTHIDRPQPTQRGQHGRPLGDRHLLQKPTVRHTPEVIDIQIHTAPQSSLKPWTLSD